MTKDIAIADEVRLLGADWFDPLEAGIRQHIRGFIENLLEEELAATLRRGRYDRSTAAAGHRNGHRDRQLLGTFGPMTVSVPRARVTGSNGRQAEWGSKTLPAYKRLTVQAERLIAERLIAERLSGWHPTRDGSGAPWRRCSAGRLARTPSAGPGARCSATGKPGKSAILPGTTSSA